MISRFLPRSSIKRALVARLPARVVPALAAGVALWSDEVELHLLDLLADPDRASVDVGANMGIFTQLLLPLSKEVHAVEAHPRLARWLRDAFGDRVTVHGVGLSDRVGTARLRIPVADGAEIDTRSSFEQDANPEYEQANVDVDRRTLDSLGLPPIGFLKVDVEGHELAVLAGAREAIAKDRPNLLVEAEDRHRAGATGELFGWAVSLGYRGFFVHGNRVHPVTTFDPEVHQIAANAKAPGASRSGRYVNNFLFAPAERADTLMPRLAARLSRLRKRDRLRASLDVLRASSD